MRFLLINFVCYILGTGNGVVATTEVVVTDVMSSVVFIVGTVEVAAEPGIEVVAGAAKRLNISCQR